VRCDPALRGSLSPFEAVLMKLHRAIVKKLNLHFIYVQTNGFIEVSRQKNLNLTKRTVHDLR